ERLQRAAMRVGAWHPPIGMFRQRSKGAARRARECRFSQSLSIELRMRPLLLDSAPEQAQRGAAAARHASVTELWFSMTVERRDNMAVTAAFCGLELNSWKLSLARRRRLGMAALGPVAQLATLRGVVKGTADADLNIQCRMFAWEMRRGSSGASQCPQQQVSEFWRRLAAEARWLRRAPSGGRQGVGGLAGANGRDAAARPRPKAPCSRRRWRRVGSVDRRSCFRDCPDRRGAAA
ncbi:unnamed protein product, partial [Prorocentrum cordatum]